MARHRTLAEGQALKGDEALTAPERALIEACGNGETCTLGDGTRPAGSDPDRTIRADLLRYLILGGCDECRVAEVGVGLQGAYISDPLDLSFATAKGRTSIANSRFETAISARQTRFDLLNLSGSAVTSLDAQNIHVTGDVFLRNGFEATGEVSLSGARIGGQLDCSKRRFTNADGYALNAQHAVVTESVFLNDGFTAKGEVSLSGARIGGQLDCSKGRFTNADGYSLNAQGVEVSNGVFLRGDFEASGVVSLSGAKISGFLDCSKARFANANGDALNAQRMHVKAGFIWRGVNISFGSIDLASAHIGDLVDDAKSWPFGGRLYLDGFTYDRITAAFTDAPRRIDWLSKGNRWNGEFFPQPYTQPANVLREMGHDRAAQEVRMKQEQLIRQHIRETSRIAPNGDVDVAFKSLWADTRNLFRWFWDIILRIVTGYGHAAGRSLIALVVLFVAATFLANRAWPEGSFAPNSGVILISPGWTDLAEDPSVANPADIWSADRAAGQDWETFNRYAYGFDVVVPILTLGQTDAWAPSTTRGSWGRQLWWARWVLSSLGWVVTALGAAAVTGLIRRE